MRNFRPILLVEDNPKDAELMLAAISAQNLINEIVTVSNGKTALEFLFDTEAQDQAAVTIPALIILDINIPHIDGLGILRAVKSSPSLTGVPVIVLTGCRRDQDEFESRRWGVQAYLQKPMNLTVFTQVLKNAGLHLALMDQRPASLG